MLKKALSIEINLLLFSSQTDNHIISGELIETCMADVSGIYDLPNLI